MKAPKVWPLKKKHVAVLALVLAVGLGGVALWQQGSAKPGATAQVSAKTGGKAKKDKADAKEQGKDETAKKEERKEGKTGDKKEGAKQEEAKRQEASSGNASGSAQAGTPAKASSASSGTQSTSPRAAPSASSSAPEGGSAPAPKKEPRWVEEQGHWEPVYETRTVYETVNDYEDYEVIVFADGYETADANAGRKYHHDTGLAYRVVTRTRVVGTHQEPSGTEQVQTGNRWVVDVPGHWE